MRIGVLTGGGDAPGLNGAIRAVVLRATALGHQAVGIRDGWAGLLAQGSASELGPDDVEGILSLGGTILGTSRTDPRRTAGSRRDALAGVKRHRLDALVAIGGNDTLSVADWLGRRGLGVVGVPKTVDNDLAETEHCIGFDTAVTVVAQALDRLRTTASAHHRVMVVEVMGRDTGWVAAVGGLTGGADIILIPELPRSVAQVASLVTRRRASGHSETVIVAAEGIHMRGLAGVQKDGKRDAFGHVRLDQRGICAALASHLEELTGIEARVVVLGHLQRGGSPTPVDRYWATRFGSAAIDLIASGRYGTLPVARGDTVAVVPLRSAASVTRRVPADMLELVSRFGGLESPRRRAGGTSRVRASSRPP
ncbi:6-phosphofructokinase [soil metagenome]